MRAGIRLEDGRVSVPVGMIKRKATLGVVLGVVAAQCLWLGENSAAAWTLRLPGRSISAAARSSEREARRSTVDVTLTSVGRHSLGVAPSDFTLSAAGDMFGVEAWNAGRPRVTIKSGHSRVFRLAFSAPGAAIDRGALFYRPASGSSGVVPLNGSASSAGPRSLSPSAQPVITSFSTAAGAGEPWGTAVDSSGNVWFAEPGCDFAPTCQSNPPSGQIGKLNPKSGAVTFYTLPDIPGNQPIFLAFDSSGKLWFTTPNNSMIGEFNPSSGTFVGQWPVAAGSGPWDLIFANGRIWYTEHLVSAVGSFNPSTHAYRDFETPSANSNPYGITASGELIWFTENNSSVDRIASLDTGNGNAIDEYPIDELPSVGTPHLIVTDTNGRPWWTEGWLGSIATLNPAAATPDACGRGSGTCGGIERFQVPSSLTCGSSTHTSGIAFQGSTKLLWLDNSLTSEVGSFDPSNDNFAMNTLSDCNAHPHDGLNVDPAGRVWFDEEFANAIGELTPPSAPPPPAPVPVNTVPPTISGSAPDTSILGTPPSRGTVKVALRNALPASLGHWTIRKLLKKGAYPVRFDAPSAGRLVISWRVARNAAHLAKGHGRRNSRRVVLATARRGFSTAGAPSVVTIRLTSAGKRLLQHATTITLTERFTFIPAGQRAVTIRRRSTLSASRRRRQ